MSTFAMPRILGSVKGSGEPRSKGRRRMSLPGRGRQSLHAAREDLAPSQSEAGKALIERR